MIRQLQLIQGYCPEESLEASQTEGNVCILTDKSTVQWLLAFESWLVLCILIFFSQNRPGPMVGDAFIMHTYKKSRRPQRKLHGPISRAHK